MSELVGRQIVSFSDSKTREMVEGVKLHYIDYQEGVEGFAALTIFIRKNHPCYDKALGLPFGEFDIVYGRRDSVKNIIQN